MMNSIEMKHVFTLILAILTLNISAQSVKGAWESSIKSEDGKDLRIVVIITEGYQVASLYEAETGAFIATNGGKWELNGDQMTETVEFDSSRPERVGETLSFKIEVTDDRLKIVEDDRQFRRIDSGKPGNLEGAWLMSGRISDGELQSRDTSRPRKTMKILSGTRFQWIAYNTETKQFMGTGGGSYTTENGKYTENIEFFSRDNTRVGTNLEFNYELKDGNWHHTGFSSKGDPLDEIWSPRSN